MGPRNLDPTHSGGVEDGAGFPKTDDCTTEPREGAQATNHALGLDDQTDLVVLLIGPASICVGVLRISNSLCP